MLLPWPLPYQQVANFAGNLSTCLAAGVELRKAIRSSTGALVKSVPEFRDVCDRIDRGESLSEALQPVSRRLPLFVIPVIQCGEQTGRLDQALQFLADHCRMLHRPSEALRNAWLFPVAIHLGGKVLCLAILFFFGSWSNTVSAVGDLIATCGSLAAMVIIFLVTPLRLVVDQVKLMIPVVGGVERELAVNRFLHVFAMLYGGGGQRVEKMVRQSALTISNYWLRQDLLRVATAVERGHTLSDAFTHTTTFNRDEQSELAAGELAGRLAETSARIAERAGESAAFKLNRITQITVRLTMGFVTLSIIGTVLPILLFSLLRG